MSRTLALRRLGLIALLTAAGLGSAGAAFGNRLLGVSLNADEGGTELTLALTGAVATHLSTLDKPARVVLDLPATRAGSLRLPAGAGLIEQLRLGSRPNGELRLVLQLKSAAKPALFTDRSGGRYQVHIKFASMLRLAAPQTVRAAHAPQGADRAVVIAVDAGHGGQDPGATGSDGTREKDVVLAIARALAGRIDREPGMRAVLTRDGDYFVELRQRMMRARAAGADMFVSIHADAVGDRGVGGASVYILSERGASSEAAKELADQQNEVDLKGGVSLADKNPELASVLLDVSQSATIGASVEAAGSVLGALDGVGAVRKREVQQAGFVVLKSPDIPSMLVETAYISNPAEERRLRTQAQQQRLAEAIFQGINAYFHKYPPEGTLFARSHALEGGAISLARKS